jgi:hypothetical protein
MQAKVGGVPALHLVSPVIGADTIPAKKVNRKTNGIRGLRNYPHASASFPTVTFGNKNKSTPMSSYLDQKATTRWSFATHFGFEHIGISLHLRIIGIRNQPEALS